ncbi:MAG: right-handed parallel beta-helix repeat-containing protein [Candidatus Glassbacteria bacterium]|nr:right-handed parallel beta-helix repeat-containing protein [Candidatus Glassbacteria bacterium]
MARRLLTACFLSVLAPAFTLYASTWHVLAGETYGDGSESWPFGTITEGLEAAQPGDTVLVAAGTYEEQVNPPRDGLFGAPVVLLGAAGNTEDRPLVYRSPENDSYYLVDNYRKHFVIEGFILDGGFGARDVVRIRGGDADSTVLRNCEIRNSMRDGIDITGGDWILIENCKVHHHLAGTYDDQQDAHGIVASEVRHLVIRNCEICYVTGDCFQADPDRSTEPYWDDVLIEDCHLWTGPLPEDAALWKAGEIPGENAIDTKVEQEYSRYKDLERPLLVLRGIKAHGWARGYIGNRAAFNIKEKVECVLDRVEVYDCEIAYRLRGSLGGALVTITNSLVYGCEKAFRVEEHVKDVHVYNSTFGLEIGQFMERSPSAGIYTGMQIINCLFLADEIPALPSMALDSSNLAVTESSFADVSSHDYRLLPSSPAAWAGVPLAGVETDLAGDPRPVDSPSLGAYEVQGGAGRKSCDINGDGKKDISDVIKLLLLGRDNPMDPAADWNGDGEYSVSDAVSLLLSIIRGLCP